jgi:hypothetical protein
MKHTHRLNKNNESKKVIKGLTFCFFFLALLLFLVFIFNPSKKIYYFIDINHGNKLVCEIEKYRERFSTYPEDLNFANSNFTKNGESMFFYERINENIFIIWFGTVFLGESILYDSRTKEWDWVSG